MKEENLYDKLRKRREYLDYSQDYVADLLGMSQPYYSFIENGKNRLKPALIQKIKKIKGLEHFDEEPPVLAPNLPGSEPVAEVAVTKPSEEQKENLETKKSEITEKAVNPPPRRGIYSIWPWSETLLYMAGSVLTLLLLHVASGMSDDIVRAFETQVKVYDTLTVVIIVFLFLLFALLWYLFILLLIRFVKWVRRQKNKNYKYL